MTPCRCTPTDTCGYCEDRISAAEDARGGHFRGFSTRDLDRAADDRADRDAGWA